MMTGRRGSIPKAVVLPSLRQTTGVSLVGDGSPPTTATTGPLSSPPAPASPGFEDFSAVLGDHAWVDDEGEMDYSFVPFSDDLDFASPLNSGATTGVGTMDSPDPVITALQQRQQEEQQLKELEKEQRDRLEVVAEARRAAERRIEELTRMQKTKPALIPVTHSPIKAESRTTVAVPNWRATAAPVVAVKKTTGPISIESSSAKLVEVNEPVKEPIKEQTETTTTAGTETLTPKLGKPASGLDFLIQSVRKAVEMHSHPVPDIHGNYPSESATKAAETQVPVILQKRKQSLEQRPFVEEEGRPLLIRMHPGDPLTRTHFTIKGNSSSTRAMLPGQYRDWSSIALSALLC